MLPRQGNDHVSVEQMWLGVRINRELYTFPISSTSPSFLAAAFEHPPKFPVVWTDGCDISTETFVNGATGLKTLLLPPHH